jgi:hypothetical protein
MTMAGYTFEKYDVLQIDWQKGDGWQDYVVLKEESKGREAARIVRGGHCQSMPHWINRDQVKFRIIDDRQKVKLTEDITVEDKDSGGRYGPPTKRTRRAENY